MSKKLRMNLRLGLIVVLIAKVICYQGASFVIEMEDIRFDLWIISSLYARSRLDCSKTCEIHGTCLSFQYSPLNGQCRLFNTIFLHQDAGVSDIGWQYYIVSNSMVNIKVFCFMLRLRFIDIKWFFSLITFISFVLSDTCTTWENFFLF